MTVGNSPDARTRHALSARLRQALPGETFLDADYRYYHDTWALDSNALSLGLSHHFGRSVVGGGAYRRYTQTGVYFYEPSYTGTPEYCTGDFRLFPFNSNSVTGHLEITPRNGFNAGRHGAVAGIRAIPLDDRHLPLALTVCLAAAAIAPLSASVDTGRLRVFRY